ncbi:hypothetical protein D9M70_506840 [compost metagenome]
MDLKGPAAEPVGHQRRDVVDVGIVLALDAAGRRDDLHIEAARCLQPGDDGADALAAGDADGVAVANLFEQQPGRRLADRLKCRLLVVGDRRDDDRAADAADRQELFFHVDQRLDRRLDLDLDQAELAAALDQPVDGRLRNAEPVGDLRLGQPFEEMQDERLVHLPCDDKFFARIRNRGQRGFGNRHVQTAFRLCSKWSIETAASRMQPLIMSCQ